LWPLTKEKDHQKMWLLYKKKIRLLVDTRSGTTRGFWLPL